VNAGIAAKKLKKAAHPHKRYVRKWFSTWKSVALGTRETIMTMILETSFISEFDLTQTRVYTSQTDIPVMVWTDILMTFCSPVQAPI
jgi:hypothetical protein